MSKLFEFFGLLRKAGSCKVLLMSHEEFESELGDVAVAQDHIERRKSDSGKWSKIRETFSENKLVDYVHYEDVEELEFQPGEMFPNIQVETDEGLKRVFFSGDDDARKCFNELKYRINVYRENYM